MLCGRLPPPADRRFPRYCRCLRKNRRNESVISLPTSGTKRAATGERRIASKEPKKFARRRATSMPIKGIPNANKNRASGGRRAASIAASKLIAEISATASNASKSSRVRRNKSAGVFAKPRATSCSMSVVPKPSISSAPRATKCDSRARSRPRASAVFALQKLAAPSRARAARRARGGEFERRGARRMRLAHAHDLRNHIARAPHFDPIADAHIFFFDEIAVVQSRVGDHGPRRL